MAAASRRFRWPRVRRAIRSGLLLAALAMAAMSQAAAWEYTFTTLAGPNEIPGAVDGTANAAGQITDVAARTLLLKLAQRGWIALPACLLFEAAAWQCRARDERIGWDAPTRRRRLRSAANNTRLLLLPWVRVPGLASHLIPPPDDLNSHADGHQMELFSSCVARSVGTMYEAIRTPTLPSVIRGIPYAEGRLPVYTGRKASKIGLWNRACIF